MRLGGTAVESFDFKREEIVQSEVKGASWRHFDA